ncbi:DUF559 domain-containing protein [Thermoactinomyces sp. FSL K6-2592]|jgi:very-short-patch-repair endonuclease|uniref:endonuclease domain-containing protein n=1 Tax=Thermoactinomyces sp. FSL K6-2592 TaxID=2975347 RepID=UPI0030F9B96B
MNKIKPMITRIRKRRYQKIDYEFSKTRSFFRALFTVLECWILNEKIQWDYQYAKAQSPIERRLYNALKNKYKVKTQVPCGRYRIDIALPRYRIAIEADGRPYHSSKKQKAHDRKKTQYLQKNGWKVLRFTGSQINGKSLRYVLSIIDQTVSESKQSKTFWRYLGY